MTRTILAVLLLSGAAAWSKEPLPITTCGQHVAKWQVGVLQNDIQCPSSFLCRPACSDIFPCDTPYQPIIRCNANCSSGQCRSTDCPNPTTDFCVLPVSGNYVRGIDVEPGGEVDLNGHTLVDAYLGIISTGLGKQLGKVTVTGPGTITGSQTAIGTGQVRGGGFSLSGNEIGIYASTVKIADVTITGGVWALFARKGGKAANLTISGATNGATSLRTLRLVDSTITGNTIDVLTVGTPRLLRSTCDASARLVQNAAQPSSYDIAGPWGVCAND